MEGTINEFKFLFFILFFLFIYFSFGHLRCFFRDVFCSVKLKKINKLNCELSIIRILSCIKLKWMCLKTLLHI